MVSEVNDSDAPETLEAFFRRLAERADSMPKRLRQCADFISQYPDRVAVSTVAELAAAAEVQPSAMMRFCQELGFTGFSQLQRLFRDEYARNWPDYATRLNNLRGMGAHSPGAMLAEFVDAGRASIEKLMTTVAPDMLEEAVETLARAPMIHIIGYRRAFPVAAYLDYAFEKMGIPSFLHTGVGKLNTGHALRRGEAMLAITFAPYSVETVAMAESAGKHGLEVVAITDSLSSPLQRLEAIPLLVSEIDVGAFRALSATFALALTLAVAVGARREGSPGRE
ncbi:MAG: RpiR family transcriptional regulator [Rhodovulum sulfidophilum]|uniref:RpiR family transcriptional regulator n=1 Tax=Rhodovulum sulfidophilum TaxID=35806 RepID=A0A2W5Q670_RHOSU|nr:MAG: RpiR family transcriptional regulator [Rhodovulum sulfidophilum]